MCNRGSQLQTVALESRMEGQGMEGQRMELSKDSNSFQHISAAYYLLDTMLNYISILKLNKMYFLPSRSLNSVEANQIPMYWEFSEWGKYYSSIGSSLTVWEKIFIV